MSQPATAWNGGPIGYLGGCESTKKGEQALDKDTFRQFSEAQIAVTISAINAGLHCLMLMAAKGMVSPQEVDEYADGLTAHFGALGHSELLDDYKSVVEHSTGEVLAKAKQMAAERWLGSDR